jgi:regulator of cell morphogenesis and NO signaling
MIQQINQITENDFVTDVVTKDYRTAAVFRKYGIDYCCGGKFPLDKSCLLRGLDVQDLIKDLENAIQHFPVSDSIKFTEWNLDFLMDYIMHIHHEYLKTTLPLLAVSLREFVEKHRIKYSYLPELQNIFEKLVNEMLPYLTQEEKIIFPYIRRMEYAYNSKETYAGLMVRTLSKPVEEVMKHNHDAIAKYLSQLRKLTNNYTPPENACTNHKVNFSMLREMDYDLLQHLHLENDILFPKAIAMENELLLQIN